MRALIASLALSAALFVAGSGFTDTATADAPNLDFRGTNLLARAAYRLTSGTQFLVTAEEGVSHAPQETEYYAVWASISTYVGEDSGLVSVTFLTASAVFDSPQLQGGLNGATLDVTLPVTYCVLDSCPTTIHVSLVWDRLGKRTHDYSNVRRETDSCRLKDIVHTSYSAAAVGGFVSDGTTNLASGETEGTLWGNHYRSVGIGDPEVCF